MSGTLKRQGDILLEHVADVPQGRSQKIEDGVIARGETTGHAHQLEGGELVRANRGQLLAVVPDGGRVTHEEHGPIELEPGVWLVHRQTEYVAPGETTQVYD